MADKLKALMDQFQQWLGEQVWAQQLQEKWDELDQQSKLYVQLVGAALGVLFGVFLILSAIWSVHSLKKEYQEKQNLLSSLQSSMEELRRLEDQIPPTAQSSSKEGSTSWSEYLEALAAGSGMDKTHFTLSPEKLGNSSERSKEFLFDISLKHISIKHLIQYIVSLENGAKPVKLRNLSVNTNNDPAGFIDASLAVSAFKIEETP
ncbi:MAG: hypothetical protein ACO3A2_10610 [Bdellovibrionia bacterium]